MAEKITIRDNSVAGSLGPSDIVDDHIFTSQEYSNTFNANLYKSATFTFKYDNLTATGGVQFQAVLEAKTDHGTWHPRAYQFNPYFSTELSSEMIIEISPTLFWPDAGVANGLWIGNRIIGEISPQPVSLPDTWRLCVSVFQPSGSTFTSLDLDIDAELTTPE